MIILFPVLILIQILICNHIILFNVAVPFIYIYYIIRLPLGISKNLLFTIAFFLGFIIDIFSDTPGVNSLSSLILAGVKDKVFYAYVAKDDKTKYIVPSISSIGWPDYLKFLISMTTIFCFICFSVEYFSYANIKDILILTSGSSLITFLLLIGIDCLVGSGKSAYTT